MLLAREEPCSTASCGRPAASAKASRNQKRRRARTSDDRNRQAPRQAEP